MKTKFFLGAHLCSLLATSAFAHDKPAAQKAKVSSQQSQQNPSLSARTQAQMAALIGRDNPAYHIQPHAGGFRMTSKASDVTGEFMAERAMFQHHDSSLGDDITRHWLWRKATGPAKNTATGSREPRGISARTCDRVVREWSAWHRTGLHNRQSARSLERKPLTLTMDLSGNVTPVLDSERQGLTLEKNGMAVLRYPA